MATESSILDTTVFSIDDGPGVTVLEVAIAALLILAGFWLARWAVRG